MTRDTTGALLAGGRSRRMGSDKSQLRTGATLLRLVLARRLEDAFGRPPMLVARPGQDIGLPTEYVIRDLEEERGAMGGLHSALSHAETPWVGLFACDMPELSRELLRAMADVPEGEEDILIPRTSGGLQPLHALYHCRCIPALERAMREGRLGLRKWASTMRLRELPQEWWQRFDPEGRSFLNLNTPLELKLWQGD